MGRDRLAGDLVDEEPTITHASFETSVIRPNPERDATFFDPFEEDPRDRGDVLRADDLVEEGLLGLVANVVGDGEASAGTASG